MNMALICMGRLKEKYWRDAANEYEKRLSRFGKFEEIELPDLPEPANSSPAVEAQICEKEGRAILQKVREDDVVIALCIGGKQLDSVQLSEKLTQFGDTGRRVVFIIGGSLGLSPQVVARANFKLSFSPMTFPHQLARVMLLEQTYRAMKIAAGERYHKSISDASIVSDRQTDGRNPRNAGAAKEKARACGMILNWSARLARWR